jgi:hypothetical protein
MTNAVFATIPGGNWVAARSYGQLTCSAGTCGALRGSPTSVYVLRGTTTDEVPSELLLEGAYDAYGISNRMVVPSNGVGTFDILVAGTRSGSAQIAGYQVNSTLARQGSATTLFATSVIPLDGDLGAWDANVVADSAHNASGIMVKGSAGASIRRVARVRTVGLISYKAGAET